MWIPPHKRKGYVAPLLASPEQVVRVPSTQPSVPQAAGLLPGNVPSPPPPAPLLHQLSIEARDPLPQFEPPSERDQHTKTPFQSSHASIPMSSHYGKALLEPPEGTHVLMVPSGVETESSKTIDEDTTLTTKVFTSPTQLGARPINRNSAPVASSSQDQSSTDLISSQWSDEGTPSSSPTSQSNLAYGVPPSPMLRNPSSPQSTPLLLIIYQTILPLEVLSSKCSHEVDTLFAQPGESTSGRVQWPVPSDGFPRLSQPIDNPPGNIPGLPPNIIRMPESGVSSNYPIGTRLGLPRAYKFLGLSRGPQFGSGPLRIRTLEILTRISIWGVKRLGALSSGPDSSNPQL
jgi:hypothetical protein